MASSLVISGDDSMGGSSRTLGLRNDAGQQNCFLNVVIQALWRLRSCRRFFAGITHETGNYILDSLAQLYNEYTFTDEPVLPPDQVRVALASMFVNMARFQLGEMDDAGESLDGILTSVHGGEIDQACHDRARCLGHCLFALSLLKEESCGIRGHERQAEESSFGFRLYAQELLEHVETGGISNLAAAIKHMHSMRNCDPPCAKCGGLMGVQYVVLSQPSVLCLNLVWPSADPSKSLVAAALNLVRPTVSRMDLSEAFDLMEQGSFASLRPYALTGMICFYPGLHYVYFGKKSNKGGESWFLFDDHQVKLVGNSFNAVVERCLLAKYHPVVLLYETREEQDNAGHPVGYSSSTGSRTTGGGEASLIQRAMDAGRGRTRRPPSDEAGFADSIEARWRRGDMLSSRLPVPTPRLNATPSPSLEERWSRGEVISKPDAVRLTQSVPGSLSRASPSYWGSSWMDRVNLNAHSMVDEPPPSYFSVVPSSRTHEEFLSGPRRARTPSPDRSSLRPAPETTNSIFSATAETGKRMLAGVFGHAVGEATDDASLTPRRGPRTRSQSPSRNDDEELQTIHLNEDDMDDRTTWSSTAVGRTRRRG